MFEGTFTLNEAHMMILVSAVVSVYLEVNNVKTLPRLPTAMTVFILPASPASNIHNFSV